MDWNEVLGCERGEGDDRAGTRSSLQNNLLRKRLSIISGPRKQRTKIRLLAALGSITRTVIYRLSTSEFIKT
ncbi:hypothetical protein J6590_107025, partial [Homalodisca vitripennis]